MQQQLWCDTRGGPARRRERGGRQGSSLRNASAETSPSTSSNDRLGQCEVIWLGATLKISRPKVTIKLKSQHRLFLRRITVDKESLTMIT